MKKFAYLLVILMLAALHKTAFGQENQDNWPWVYMSEFQVPWSRIDSLMKLENITDKEWNWYEKAKEMGHIIDFRFMLHHTGDEWNVRYEWVYPSWEAMNKSDWMKEVSEAVEPDSTKRKPINEGYQWVFKDVTHRDQIYRLVIGAR